MSLFNQFFPFSNQYGSSPEQQHRFQLQAYQSAMMNQQAMARTFVAKPKPGLMWVKWLRANRISASIEKQFKSQITPTPEQIYENLKF